MGNPDGAPGSWLGPGLALAVAGTWRGNQWVEDVAHHPVSLSVTLPFIQVDGNKYMNFFFFFKEQLLENSG